MSFWGVGPLYGVSNLLLLGIAGGFTFIYPEYVMFHQGLCYVFGGLCILFGLYLWIAAGKEVDKCILKGILATKGPYGIVRNPIYSGILFVVSGLCFIIQSWLLLATIPLSYGILKLLLRKEDRLLTKAFGETYLRYKKQTHSVLPKLGAIYHAFFYPVETQRITEALFAVKNRDVNFFIYKTAHQTLCFDTGYGDHKIVEELSKLGIDPGDITTVFLTHSDPDHAKGLPLFPKATCYLGRAEEPLINGQRKRMICYRNPTITREYRLLEDQQTVMIDQTIVKTLYTTGHTIGHVMYQINEDILISGDAVIAQNGSIKPFYRPFNMNHAKTVEAAKEIRKFEKSHLICTAHTGISYPSTGKSFKSLDL